MVTESTYNASNIKALQGRTQLVVISAIVVSILLILFGIINNQQAAEQFRADANHLLKLQTYNEQLRYYDEALTMSARMAAVTGDSQWEARFNAIAPKLEQVITLATAEDHQHILPVIADANNHLIQIEMELFKFVRRGQGGQALALLSSDEYMQHKESYTNGVERLRAALEQEASESLANMSSRGMKTTLMLVAETLLLIGVWSYVLVLFSQNRRAIQQYSKQLTQLAHYDSLTGLVNRSLFQSRMEEELSRSRRENKSLAVMLMDLDNFKQVNDTLGHPAGDELLKTVAERLVGRCRDVDTVARLGGDEFVIMATSIGEEFNASILAENLLEICSSPIELEGQTLTPSCSIGISLYPGDADCKEELLRKADFALYQAKGAGRDTYKYYDAQTETQIQSRKQLEAEIDKGLREQQFELYYQPLVDMTTGHLRGVEALIRWHHPQRGLVPPNEFIPVAEASGLIIPLGDWVLAEACCQQVLWAQEGLGELGMAVNLSALQFDSKELIKTVDRTIQKSGIKPEYLTLEITEGTVMEHGDEVLERLRSLSALGVQLSIDDFGTGYSSLSYLKRFPIDYLKIDRSFVRDLPDDKEDMAITLAIIEMSRALNLKVVAEGIEDERQLDFLRDRGCNLGQGYFLAKPMPASKLEGYVEQLQSEEPSREIEA